jgi:Tfp pilus assembly protein PilO
MKATDRAIVLGILILGLVVAFWLLVLAPKRAEVSDLDGQISDLRTSLASAEQTAAAAEQAQDDYASNYHDLVVLGKAVPPEEDTSSLLVQIQTLAERAGISFDAIKLSETGDAAPPPPASETTADQSSGDSGAAAGDASRSAASADAATPETASTLTGSVPATEAAAAPLPLGATVGTAGLPVMPYDLHFRGDFFQVADFIQGLDDLVQSESAGVGVDGRLLTIDGFSFGPDEQAGFPHLVASLHVTSYVAPADQGLTAGATPSAPAGAVPADPVTTTSTPTPSP